MSTTSSCSESASNSTSSFETDTSETLYSDMSVSSTPNKPGAHHLEDATVRDFYAHLRDDIDGRLGCGAPLEAFVRHVWGLAPEHINAILSHTWSLKPDSLETYRTAPTEPDMYDPFSQIADQLVNDVRAFLGVEKETCTKFWSDKGKHDIISAVTKRRPDMLSLLIHVLLPRWALARQIIEFKKLRAFAWAKGETPVTSLASSDVLSQGTLGVQSTSAAAPRKTRSKKKKASNKPKAKASLLSQSVGPIAVEAGAPSTSADVACNNVLVTPTNSTKRKHDGEHDDTPAKIPRMSQSSPYYLTDDHLQLATYALESLAVSTRHYTSGILIDRCIFSLWYYDRACVIRTEEFDFSTDLGIAQLALVLYAVSMCDDRHCGYDPLVIPAEPKPTTAASAGAVSDAAQNSEPQTARTARSETKGKKAQATIEDNLHMTGAQMVFPPTDEFKHGRTFILRDRLFGYHGLVGRGTMVYGVDDDEALKIGWPVTVRPLEATTIATLLERIPEWKDHLPEVSFSATLTAEQLGLPRSDFQSMVKFQRFEERQLHALCMKRYQKLWELNSVEEFMEVFVDCLECHYHAYTTGRVSHRHLSENNLMFKRCGDRARGVLNDWDLASLSMDNSGQVPTSHARQRTWNLPFMAFDLLEKPPPLYLYRHDLESFFYILVWSAIHYDFKGKRRLSTPALLKSWNKDYLACEAKFSFIMSAAGRDRVFYHIQPEFHGLRDQWLMPLWKLFFLARNSYNTLMAISPQSEYDPTTFDNSLTFSTFMAAIGRNHVNSLPHPQGRRLRNV
ncbi:hypothetical protein Hypma_003576 [Hypsizygus marmoreus]|uniref:Fungal-type protein kinase domain-containing protein n=1 Tax=Hypsizygus marmoreus TaxID=39966 RepID=A0A369J5V1_HYPMA|nr:hypothetical protein Hypma_003576 [Hypsizygus marmoreus]